MNIPTPAKKTRKSPLNKASHISQVCFSKPLTLDFFYLFSGGPGGRGGLGRDCRIELVDVLDRDKLSVSQSGSRGLTNVSKSSKVPSCLYIQLRYAVQFIYFIQIFHTDVLNELWLPGAQFLVGNFGNLPDQMERLFY